MIFSILPATITTLFLSANLITTLSFNDDIRSFVYGGNKEDVFLELTNNNKTLVIKAKKKDLHTNMLIMTSKGRYYFDVKIDEKKPHQFIEINDGQVNSAFKSIFATDKYEILQGVTSVLFINKTKVSIEVNGLQVKSKEHFSLGVPIIVNGERILN